MSGAKTKKVFDDSCPIMPEVIGQMIVEEAKSLFAPIIGDDAFVVANQVVMIRILAEKAETSCQANARFRRSIVGAKGNAGRDKLYVFMRHWLASYLAERYPHIRQTPNGIFDAFAIGVEVK